MRLRDGVHGALCAVIVGCASDPDELRFGAMLAQTVGLLVLVCGLAVVTLRLAARFGIGTRTSASPGRRLEVLDELPVGPRQSVVALRAGSRVIVASRTATTMAPLAELDLDEWRAGGADGAVPSFAAVLANTDGPESTDASPNRQRSHETGPERREQTLEDPELIA